MDKLKIIIMEKKLLNETTMKRTYVRPQIEVIKLQSESLLQTASGNAGKIGQGSGGTTTVITEDGESHTTYGD